MTRPKAVQLNWYVKIFLMEAFKIQNPPPNYYIIKI